MVQKRSSTAFQQVGSGNSNWWRQNSPYKEIYNENWGEWKLGFVGLIFSLCILTAKLMSTNRDYLYQLVFETRLVQYKTVVTDGEVVFKYAWTNIWRYSKFWYPALCGGLITWFTWIMVFLDSSVPGITPPSPLSPSKLKMQSGHTFHLNYVFAIVIGVLVSAYMYANGIGLEY